MTTPTEAPSTVREAAAFDRLLLAGMALANCAFNLKQRTENTLTDREREVLSECQAKWDAAVQTRNEIRAALSTPTVPAAEAPKPSRLLNFDRVAACLKILDSRPRPMCRDCADEDGICPSSGLNCDMRKLIGWVATARCELCDNTGDIHDRTGEWRGECPNCRPTVPAAEAPKPATYHLTIHTDRWDATRRTFASDLVKVNEALATPPTEPSSDNPRPVQPAEGETPSDKYRAALVKIAALDDEWGPFPEANNPAWGAMAIVTAREVLVSPSPEAQAPSEPIKWPEPMVDRNDPAPRGWTSIHHSGEVQGWNECLKACKRAALKGEAP